MEPVDSNAIVVGLAIDQFLGEILHLITDRTQGRCAANRITSVDLFAILCCAIIRSRSCCDVSAPTLVMQTAENSFSAGLYNSRVFVNQEDKNVAHGDFQTINAFISYSHKDRNFARQAKSVLGTFGIDAFLAHQDIGVSHDWRDRIVQELKRCELFLPLLSKNFLASQWAPQETGFIVSRPDVKVIPIALDGTIAFGFISNIQSRRIDGEEITSDFLLPALVNNFPRSIFPHLIDLVRTASSFREGEAKLERLLPYLKDLTPDEAKALAENCVKNPQVWDAMRCRDNYLPEFIRIQGKHMGVKNRRALQYQITNHDSYRPTEHD